MKSNIRECRWGGCENVVHVDDTLCDFHSSVKEKWGFMGELLRLRSPLTIEDIDFDTMEEWAEFGEESNEG